jgi:tRNA(Ile)-lysidine synthase
MLPLESELAAQLRAHDWQAVTSLVAVSGGADSVALLCALSAIRDSGASGRLVVVHFNHGLRGVDSDDDAQIVQGMGARFGLQVKVGRAKQGTLQQQGDSLEAAARDARYRFFENIANKLGARYLFTAHTANDQAETILHRILRGTGLDGLAGIPRVRPLSELTTIVRPMLGITRQEVLAYLQSCGQQFREDESNIDRRFTRNRLRHELLPHLATNYNPQIMTALTRLGQLAGEAQACLERQVRDLERRCVVSCEGEVRVSCHELAREEPYLVRQLFIALWQQQGWPLQPMTFDKWQQLAELAQLPQDGALDLPGKVHARKIGAELILSRG